MTKEELIVLLRNPDQAGQAIRELKGLIEEYPFFHTAHQLYIKGLQEADEKKMIFQLKKTALFVRDRDILYHYINRLSNENHHNIQSDSSQPSLPETTDEISQNADDQINVEVKMFCIDQLSKLIASQPKQLLPYIPEEEKRPLPEIITAAVDTPETPADTVSVEIREVYSEKQLVADLIKTASLRTDVIETIPQKNTVKEKTKDNHAPVDQHRRWSDSELIDFFLKSNHKITPNNNQYEVDLSESLQDNQDDATETLADIYVAQGHKDKAIEIYQQLILKYPEKHIYFAAQIERLKE